jgi:hypothetical protein
MLPGLFEIEAIVAPDRSNVTLLVNGSALGHNIIIECQNIIDATSGQKESMFQLTLQLAGNFINYTRDLQQLTNLSYNKFYLPDPIPAATVQCTV